MTNYKLHRQDYPKPEPKDEHSSDSAQGGGAMAIGPRGVYVGGNVYGNIITGDIYNYFIDGTRFYMPEFTTAVKNFLYNYLGDEDNPVPFGGRDDAVAQLEQWRIRKDAQRMLLTAPAGRGKSALLVRWSTFLQKKQDLAVVFIPISIRFNTNQENDTFSLLATRLAHLYGKELPANWGNFSPSAWRRLVADYLQEPLPDGRDLLLIMDGLDEAPWQPGADLFPHQLPEQVRLVISARYRGGEESGPGPWLRQLGWDRFPQKTSTMELEALTQTGVRDVLEKMGCPLDGLGRNVDILAELHRLSEGDPLLVELYVKDLWQRRAEAIRLQPEDLRDIQPGYKGYFKKWWEEQEKLWGQNDPLEKGLVIDVLDALAIALGPLSLIDLRDLLPKQVSSRDVRRALHPLQRFVIGDGKKQGYVFSHPKLGIYFRDELEKDEQAIWQERFLSWGIQTLEDLRTQRMLPSKVSQYLMVYFGQHFEEAFHQNWEDRETLIQQFLQLVTWEWMQVSFVSTGTYKDFLQDIHRVWTCLQLTNTSLTQSNLNALYLGQEMLCAFCIASINSLVTNIPEKLLVALLHFGYWTENQTIAYIFQQPDIKKRAEALAMVTPYLTEKTKTNGWENIFFASRTLKDSLYRAEVLAIAAFHVMGETREVALKEIFTLAQDIKDEWDKAGVLASVASFKPTLVHDISNALDDEWSRVRVLSSLASFSPKEVMNSVLGIKETEGKAKVLTALAPYLPREVLKVSEQITHDGFLARILAALAPYTPEESLDTGWKIKDEGSFAEVIAAVAPYKPERALKALQEISYVGSKAMVLASIAENFPDLVFIEAKKLTDESFQVKVLAAVASFFPREILGIAPTIRAPEERAKILLNILPYLDTEECVTVLEEILAISRRLEDKDHQIELIVNIIPYFLEEDILTLLQEALSVAWSINDKNLLEELQKQYHDEVWVKSNPHLTNQEKMTAELIELVLPIAREEGDALILAAIIPDLHETLRQTIAKETLIAARQMDDGDETKLRVLESLATYLPEEIFEEATKIPYNNYRMELIVSLTPHLIILPKQQIYLNLKKALQYLCLRTRPQLLSDITSLVPIINALGSEKAIQDTWLAYETVSAWWP